MFFVHKTEIDHASNENEVIPEANPETGSIYDAALGDDNLKFSTVVAERSISDVGIT